MSFIVSGKTLNVLIAEDDFLVSEEIVRLLNKIGHNVVGVAPNGLKAIEMVKEHLPDLVLMDIKMPKLNGLEAAKIIQDSYPTPIIILTAHETHELVEEASNSGVGAYLTKPPDMEEVKRAITIAFARQTDLIRSRQLIKQLERSEAELKELNASKDKFFSIIAHDLRNPVSALIGYSNLLVDTFFEMDDIERYELSNGIKQISNNVSTLLENLLEWSRYERGKMEYTPKIFVITETLDRVISLHSPSAERKNIIVKNNADHNCEIFADQNMVETILRNLVSNAIKFTKSGGQINIQTTYRDNDILIEVKDNGIGMTQKQIEGLFSLDKSISKKGTNNEKGSGLGLILCKELVEKNKGTLSVESKFNEGSTFKFTLPMYKSA